MINKHPGLGIANRFNIPDCPERVHWEHDFATMVGAPGAYDYGPERCSWVIHQMTDWIGDDGFLRSSASKIRRHLFFPARDRSRLQCRMNSPSDFPR